MRKEWFALACLGSFGAAGPLTSQQGQPPCAGAEHRQFDFWIGEWGVTVVGSRRVAGTNSITSILGGCVLLESYETAGGYRGNSHNAYDRSTGQWHQTWVVSSDGGKTWTTAFDGMSRKRGG